MSLVRYVIYAITLCTLTVSTSRAEYPEHTERESHLQKEMENCKASYRKLLNDHKKDVPEDELAAYCGCRAGTSLDFFAIQTGMTNILDKDLKNLIHTYTLSSGSDCLIFVHPK